MANRLKKLLVELSAKSKLQSIKREIQPSGKGKNRRQSATVWKALGKHFGYEKGNPEKDQDCSNDSTCFREIVMANLKTLNDDDLQRVQTIAAAMFSIAPYNTLKQWFPPINKFAAKTVKNVVQVQRIASYMKIPEQQGQVQINQQNQRVIKKNRQQLVVNYRRSWRIVHKWMESDDWRLKFLAVMASVGMRKTALLDSRIKFAEAEKHDKRFWIVQLGVLKDKTAVFDDCDNDGDCDYEPGKTVEKPIAYGFTYDEIMAAIKLIRTKTKSMTKGKTRSQIGAIKPVKFMVQAVKDEFRSQAKIFPRLGTHFLRALYANVAYHFFQDEIGDSITAFISTVLAHNANSLQTALSYQGLRIIYGVPENIEQSTKLTSRDNREEIARLRDEIATLRRRVTREEKEEKLDEDCAMATWELDDGKTVSIKRLPCTGRKRQRNDSRLAKVEEAYDALKKAGVKNVSGNMILSGNIGVNKKFVYNAVKKLKLK